MSTDINTPVVLLTGGSQGLGYELAKQLLRDGFAVSFCARTPSHVAQAGVELERFGLVSAFVGDVADAVFQQCFVGETVRRFGRIDAVVNNASTLGAVPLSNVLSGQPEDYRLTFEMNVIAPIQLSRLAMPHLRRQSQSLVLAISSDAAVGGYPGWGMYGASKAASDLLHKTLAVELRETSVHVYTVDPGDMDTAMHRAADPDATNLPHPATVAKQLSALFRPLVVDAPWCYPSGVRLMVTDTGVADTESRR